MTQTNLNVDVKIYYRTGEFKKIQKLFHKSLKENGLKFAGETASEPEFSYFYFRIEGTLVSSKSEKETRKVFHQILEEVSESIKAFSSSRKITPTDIKPDFWPQRIKKLVKTFDTAFVTLITVMPFIILSLVLLMVITKTEAAEVSQPQQIYRNNQDINLQVEYQIAMDFVKKDVKTLTADELISITDGDLAEDISNYLVSLFSEDYEEDPKPVKIVLIATKSGQTESKVVYLEQKDIIVPKGVKYTKISKIELYDKETTVKTFITNQKETQTYVKFTFEEDKEKFAKRKEEEQTKTELQNFLNKK